jgi:AraC-like DNA-binding protein
VSEVLHASFVEHAYPLHCHDTWTVLLIDQGEVRYDLDRRERGADRRRVTVLPPFVAHDGRSARPGRRFRKRVLYIDTDRIGDHLVGAAVDRSSIDDPALRRAVSQLHHSLDGPADDLRSETLLALVVERITGRLAGATRVGEQAGGPEARGVGLRSPAAEALRAAIDADPGRRVTLDGLAAELGWSPTHLVRSFTRRFGLPPHRYLIGRRIEEARRQLLDGLPPAEVAVNVGFHDQAHLGRHFKRHLGVSPGRYRPGGRG